MSGINKVFLIGRVGRDPEIKTLSSGATIATFSLATSEKWTDKETGEKNEKTEWHRCTAWRKLAEIISQYVAKGSLIYVEGKLQTRSWEKDGEKRYATEILVNNMQMLDSRREGSAGKTTEDKGFGDPPPNREPGPDDGDDIPF